jgi:hypothetical protein
LVANLHRRWRDISPALPDWPIRVIDPPPTSGTRDSFTDLVLLAGCRTQPEGRATTDTAQRRRACVTVRENGGWEDGGEDDAVIVQRVADSEVGTLGVFGYSFLDGHRARIAALRIAGVEPSVDTIAARHYPFARPLFIYAKRANLRPVPGLSAFLTDYVADAAMGPGGPLLWRGLVPLEAAGLARRIGPHASGDGALPVRPPAGRRGPGRGADAHGGAVARRLRRAAGVAGGAGPLNGAGAAMAATIQSRKAAIGARASAPSGQTT